jgi:hypothetical protein
MLLAGLGRTIVGNLFHIVGKIVSTLLGLLMVCMGGVWFLQGTGIAFQVGFMAGAPEWALYGASSPRWESSRSSGA